jgi:hypothetical protein
MDGEFGSAPACYGSSLGSSPDITPKQYMGKRMAKKVSKKEIKLTAWDIPIHVEKIL